MIIPIIDVVSCLQTLTNALNLIIQIWFNSNDVATNQYILPIPGVLNMIHILVHGLQIIMDAFEQNRKMCKAHLLIKHLRGYRLLYSIFMYVKSICLLEFIFVQLNGNKFFLNEGS